MNLRHYYHLYADGDFQGILLDHLSILKSSGLLEALERLHIGFVGSPANVDAARYAVLRQIGPRFSSHVAAAGWEQETQDVLFADAVSATAPFLALYAHTKGSTNDTELTRLWRRAMTRYNILQWRDAIAQFDDNVGAVGCFWAPLAKQQLPPGTPINYFGGNFWWVRSEAIAKIGPPERNDRYGAEAWIGGVVSGPQPYEIRCLLDVPIDVGALEPHGSYDIS